MTTTQKWNDERTATLKNLVGSESPVSAATVESAAATLETTVRSVAAKLRKEGYEVASTAKSTAPTFTADEAEALKNFVESNAGSYTYAEIAENFADGKFSAKQVQGKILSLELTGSVKATEKQEVARTYTEAEEAKLVDLASAGAYLEDIAAALGKELNSVRGKALSMLRSGALTSIPAQKNHVAKEVDPIAKLGDLVKMTVEEIAKATGKTTRGIKTILTRRQLVAADYDGAEKAAKAAAKAA